MTDQEKQAIREILLGVFRVAKEERDREEAKLGRKLTEGEAQRLAGMIDRQFRTALILAKG